MKNRNKILLINGLLIIFCFVILDYIAYRMLKNETPHEQDKNANYFQYYLSYDKTIPNTINGLKQKIKDQSEFKYITNPQNKKQTILIFGCSFAFGSLLNEEEKFAYKLAMKTKRNIYNFALPGNGMQHIIPIIKSETFNSVLKEETPSHVIYLYIPNHIERMNYNIFGGYLVNDLNFRYKLKNGELTTNKIFEHPIIRIMFTNFIAKKIIYIHQTQNNELTEKKKYNNFLLMSKIFIIGKNELKKKYKDIKFVIIRYRIKDDNDLMETPYVWNYLEKQGFIILDTESLIGRKYENNSEDTTSDGYHPSEKVWNELTPRIIEKLQL